LTTSSCDDVDAALSLTSAVVPNQTGIAPGGLKQVCAEFFELLPGRGIFKVVKLAH
jgi:hypothetical protein